MLFILRAAAEPGEDEEDRDEDGGLVRADNDVTVAEEAEGIEEVDNKLELYHSEYAPAMSRVH
ncbi:hypothetical protein HK097_010366 [Rhizophlyctis rosea]|uniref:Uncharacterized protein n=1 Tax=Rhizophlyctis rosea TaxID=64517 RepID=A0AAD5WZT9_9FUNG|nr:hypothetical protein HK097_010366 [Rhizophlyctis rosea]